MTPHYINPKKLERAERAREIINELADCSTILELNNIRKLYEKDIIRLKLTNHVSAAVKRIQAVEINKSFNH